MKKTFFDELMRLMKENPDIFFISVGLGYPRTDEFKEVFPDRYIQTEAAEQTALDIACGIAESGRIPVVYSITPFLLWRAAETIRTFINHEQMNVKLIGVGRDDDYSIHDGFTHDATDDKEFLALMKNIKVYHPQNDDECREVLQGIINYTGACYLNLTR